MIVLTGTVVKNVEWPRNIDCTAVIEESRDPIKDALLTNFDVEWIKQENVTISITLVPKTTW